MRGRGIQSKELDGSKLKVGLVVAHYNSDYTEPMKKMCRQALLDSGVKDENIFKIEVAGAYEVLYGINKMLQIHPDLDVIVPLACLIKGETYHFEYISEAVTQGIMKYNVEGRVPVIFGILNCLTEEQAKTRTQMSEKSSAYEYGRTAVEMGLLKRNKE